jgi:hypothetical protein
VRTLAETPVLLGANHYLSRDAVHCGVGLVDKP